MMANCGKRGLWLWGLAVVILNMASGVSRAEPVDFTTFTVDSFPRTNGPLAQWLTTPDEARINDAPAAEGGTPNASANVFYGPDSALNKRFVGTLTPGTDDDVIGFVLGYGPGDADWLNFNFDADYLLIDWKGVTQNFDFVDPPGEGIFFHDQTLGGDMPAGLALSRISGVPTADELWQHVDSDDNLDGGVEELARAATLGSSAYPRNNSSVVFDIRYTPTNVTVLVDGVEQFNESGTYPDGRFGLYSLNQGPSAIWSDFEMFDLDETASATIDRDTGEVVLTNPTGSAIDFTSFSLVSSSGALDPAEWTSIAGNYDSGGPDAVDSDPWSIVSSTSFELSEEEEGAGGDGATLGAGQSISLGAAWLQSPFEDLLMTLQTVGGDDHPVIVEFINGPGNDGFERSDLNTDGVIDEEDWPLFYENTLTDLSGLSPARQYLRGDLDGDGDNDGFDFAIFKSDFDLANGAGAFAAMFAGVPEPSSFALLALCLALMVAAARRHGIRLRRRLAAMAAVSGAVLGGATTAVAVPLDFTTFTVENFPHTDSNADPATDFFPLADWASVSFANLATHNNNANPNVFYSQQSALDKVITGTLTPGTDDDMVGFVLGFQPGNATLGDPSIATADYLLIDWKGASQTFNWVDFADTGNVFHDLTPGTPAPVGLALSRVTGLPTADELWGHVDFEENPDGGVVQLARGATLGGSAYPRDNTSVEFEIRYTSSYVAVDVDGVRQFLQTGSFGDGRFGLYTSGHGPPPTYSDFEMIDVSELGLLRAVVHRDTGEIELENGSPIPIEFDFYQLTSPSQSLNPAGWNSLSEQEFQAIGSGEGETWAEAGGSDSGDLAELFLRSASSLASSAAVSLGNAYNSQINGEDLVLSYRLPDGTFEVGLVEYMGEASAGISGDYNGSGLVEQADLDLVLGNWGADGTVPPPTWINDPPTGFIDQEELDGVLGNWGSMSGGGSLASAASVPEPTTLMLVVAAVLPLIAVRRVRFAG